MDNRWLTQLFKDHPDKSQSNLARFLRLDPSIITRMVKGTRGIKGAEVPKINQFFGEISGKPQTKESGAFVQIDELGVNAAGGHGAIVDDGDHDVVATWRIGKEFICEVSGHANLKIIRVIVESMVPNLLPGDRVIVDTEARIPSPPGMFAIWDGMGLMIKNVELIPNSKPPKIRLTSYNTIFGAYEMKLDECIIQGRIIAKMQRT